MTGLDEIQFLTDAGIPADVDKARHPVPARRVYKLVLFEPDATTKSGAGFWFRRPTLLDDHQAGELVERLEALVADVESKPAPAGAGPTKQKPAKRRSPRSGRPGSRKPG